jgi:hypothetical protein
VASSRHGDEGGHQVTVPRTWPSSTATRSSASRARRLASVSCAS